MGATERAGKEWAPPPLRPYESMIINVALTGAVPTKDDSPALPVTPEEVAEDAVACADAGASIIHIHVRDEAGNPVHDRGLYERAIGPIRDKRPDVIICATTSGRVDPDPTSRMTALELDESLRPEMASLTLGSFNFPKTVSHNSPEMIRALLERMQDRGVKPELEVFELGMVNTAHALIDQGLIGENPYFNIILGSFGSAPAFIGDLAAIVQRLPHGSVWAGGGVGVFQQAMVVAAAVMGGNVRTGLEDAPRLPSGDPNSNVQSVEAAEAAATLVGRSIATPDEARARLGLSAR